MKSKKISKINKKTKIKPKWCGLPDWITCCTMSCLKYPDMPCDFKNNNTYTEL